MRLALVMLWCSLLAGCALLYNKRQDFELDNPLFVPVNNADFAWDQIVDVVDDDFEIEREDRVKRIGNTFTEGRIDTFPLISATALEPWHRDSVTRQDRLLATLQSMRHLAMLRVIPVEGGYFVDVAVYKELEDTRPEFSPTDLATFRSDTSLERLPETVSPERAPLGWIPEGREPALEQRILSKIAERLNPPGTMPQGHVLMQ